MKQEQLPASWRILTSQSPCSDLPTIYRFTQFAFRHHFPQSLELMRNEARVLIIYHLLRRDSLANISVLISSIAFTSIKPTFPLWSAARLPENWETSYIRTNLSVDVLWICCHTVFCGRLRRLAQEDWSRIWVISGLIWTQIMHKMEDVEQYRWYWNCLGIVSSLEKEVGHHFFNSWNWLKWIKNGRSCGKT